MTAKDLINHSIIPLRSSDNGYLGMQMMDEYKVEHLPIVDGDDYFALISELDILNSNDPEMEIKNHPISMGNIFIYEDQHLYDVLALVANKEITVIPVLSRKHKYLGAIILKSLISQFVKFSSINLMGSIIVIEVNTNDYSLNQIAQIVEYNDAKILFSSAVVLPESTKMEVTIKLNKTEISAIIQTFNRYNYIIKNYYTEDVELDDFHDRYDEFMKWLNV